MNFEIVPTPPFERELKHLSKKYPSIKYDISELARQLEFQPTLGQPLGNNCYKIRMAVSSKGRGKSGGARIITFVQVIDKIIFLIAIYDKSEMENISDANIRARLKFIQNK